MLNKRIFTFILFFLGILLVYKDTYAVNYTIAIREIPLQNCLSKKSKSFVHNIGSCGLSSMNNSNSVDAFSSINSLVSQAKHYVAVFQIDGADNSSICYQLSDMGHSWQAQVVENSYLNIGDSVGVVFTTHEKATADQIWSSFKIIFRQCASSNLYVPFVNDCETTIRSTIQSFGGLLKSFPFNGNAQILFGGKSSDY